MSIKIRTLKPDEHQAFFRADSAAFSDEWDAEELELEKALMDPERMVTAEDDGELVAGGGAFTFDMTVPGGSAGCAGVTWIGVTPPYRRRGILTGMMAHLHEDARRRGEPLAALWAAESSIYPRFGYGLAAADLAYEIDRGRTAWMHPRNPPGKIRLVDAKAAATSFAPVYDHERLRRPGMVGRNDAWWKDRLFDGKDRRGGAGPLFHVVCQGAAGAEGYLAYRVKQDWESSNAQGVLKVLELMSTTIDAYQALWSYAFSVDLVDRIQARHRPMDDPLRWMLSDFRRLETLSRDALWVRLVDVDAALAARRYSSEGSLVLEVGDAGCPWNAGRHRLEGGRDGATCAPTESEPDLRLDVGDLGAVYMGGVELALLAAAGRVEECRPGALEKADSMFRWRPMPWSVSVF